MTARKALVAGGSGFLGSRLCELLLEEGADVVAFDSLVTGRRENIAGLSERGLRFVQGDVRDFSALASAGDSFDEIYNLASPASPVDFKRIPLHILETASVGHKNCLELALKCGGRALLASTSEIYGDALVHPQIESYLGNVNSVGPRGCYDEAKRYAEALTMAYRRERGASVRIARIFNTYGPRMRLDDGRIIPNFFMQAIQGEPLTVYGNGSQTRSFCYVDDMARGLTALMRSAEERPVNLGNPVERTVLEIARAINAIAGNAAGVRALPLPEDDPRQRCPDVSRATESLGWVPRVSLEEGLRRTYDYFRAAARESGRVDTPNAD